MADDRVVFITNFSSHDYSDAQRFGTLRPVTSGTLNLLNTDRILTIALEELRESTPDDYLLISGPPVACLLIVTVWLAMHGRCKLLILDAKEREYVERTISNEQILAAVENFR